MTSKSKTEKTRGKLRGKHDHALKEKPPEPKRQAKKTEKEAA